MDKKRLKDFVIRDVPAKKKVWNPCRTGKKFLKSVPCRSGKKNLNPCRADRKPARIEPWVRLPPYCFCSSDNNINNVFSTLDFRRVSSAFWTILIWWNLVDPAWPGSLPPSTSILIPHKSSSSSQMRSGPFLKSLGRVLKTKILLAIFSKRLKIRYLKIR